MERFHEGPRATVNLTFISLLDIEKFRGGSVLGAPVPLLVGVKNDGQGSVAFPYLGLGGSIGQIEHGTESNVSEEGNKGPLD